MIHAESVGDAVVGGEIVREHDGIGRRSGGHEFLASALLRPWQDLGADPVFEGRSLTPPTTVFPTMPAGIASDSAQNSSLTAPTYHHEAGNTGNITLLLQRL